MTFLWGLSLAFKDASLVDRFWGLGFILVSLYSFSQTQFLTFRAAFLFLLVSIWGIRLSVYIHLRNRGKPEDLRYRKMRQRSGSNFIWKSYFSVFLLQGALLWIIAFPLAIIHLFPQPDVPTLFDLAGLLLWTTGFFFEAIADYQLSQFKKKNKSKNAVCRTGLWAISRHPNYFGECLVWWGYFLIALNIDNGWMTVISPLLMTFLLLKVSGVALLEKELSESKPEYAQYIREVPAFFPWRNNAT